MSDDVAGVSACLVRLAADLRRACAEGRIRGRFARGNALGLAKAIDATLGAGEAVSPQAFREIHQHLKGLVGHAVAQRPLDPTRGAMADSG